jgi:RHS repeat-associated protein
MNGVETRYLLDEGITANVWEEYASNGMVQASYAYGNDLITQTQAEQTSYYLVDGLGSTRLLLDSQGQVLNTYGYEAFGETVSQSGTASNKYQYAGEQFDEALGDYYLRQRFYDTNSGRFGRMDTYKGRIKDPLSQHKYIYAYGNAVDRLDPSGFDAVEGNILGSKIGMNFSGLDAHLNNSATLTNDMFTVDRVYEARWPFTTGAKPTVRRIFRTASGNPNHPGMRNFNGKVIDLVDFATREFYEIGPESDRRKIENDRRKMEQVINGLTSAGYEGWSLGDSYSPPLFIPLSWGPENFGANFSPSGIDSFRKGKIALVTRSSPGMITYKIFNTHYGDALFAAGILSMALLIDLVISKMASSQRTFGLA